MSEESGPRAPRTGRVPVCHAAAARSALIAVAVIAGCGRAPDPVQQTSRDLERYPEYSVIIEDLKVEDGFFPDYFLRLRLMTASGQRVAGKDTLVYEDRVTDWLEVEEEVMARYQHYLGMVVASKTLDGGRTTARQAHPPGYQYVGNSQYGYWGGGGFWQFYGQYAFMSAMLGGFGVGRGDYNDYRRNREVGRPHYGPTRQGRPTFGTAGTQTRKTRPNFYQRYQQRSAGGGRGFATRTASSRGGGRFGK
ncbi:MAG: hypothetical protein OXG13_20515 [Gemmatimonadaceae bacterium]|nr:hypothetical protein [Gemmatimonadaceae bacterium]